jgi:ABC-type multidrug transport system ATPase subunit
VSGKSTTVRILATLSRPDGGRARVAGFDVVRDRRQVRRYPPYPPPAVSASSGTNSAALTVPTPDARS